MPSKEDVSYGVIPVRQTETGWEVFLIHQHSALGGDNYWVFPKGHQEAGETPEAAAVRELREETGLVPKQIDTKQPFSMKYTFVCKGTRIYKTVVYFVGEVLPARPRLQVTEVIDAGWFTLSEAAGRLTHDTTRAVLENVRQYLDQRQAVVA